MSKNFILRLVLGFTPKRREYMIFFFDSIKTLFIANYFIPKLRRLPVHELIKFVSKFVQIRSNETDDANILKTVDNLILLKYLNEFI